MADIYKVNTPIRKPLFEGVQGENEARSIQFDITPWVEELGDGAVTATAKRSQDSQPYPVTVTKDGTTVTWKPTSTDTAYAGVGSFQLEYTVDSVLAKTCIWSTMVAPSLDPAGDPPDPYDNWLAEMRQIAADAIQAADDAEESAQEAESYTLRAFITKNASGEVANFADGADDVPMKSLKVAIVPKQAGSGDPSPDNVRPITGWNDIELVVAGINQFDKTEVVDGKYILYNGIETDNAGMFCTGYIPCTPNTEYFTNTTTRGLAYTIFFFRKDKSKISFADMANTTFTTPDDAYFMRLNALKSAVSIDALVVNRPPTERGYHDFNGIRTTPVPLGQTVYGGELDVTSGGLTVTWAAARIGALSWGYNSNGNYFYTSSVNKKTGAFNIMSDIYATATVDDVTRMGDYHIKGSAANNNVFVTDSRYTTAADFKSANEQRYIYIEAATPTTIQLTPTQVATLLGTNNVWADCGSVAVEYRADPTLAYNEISPSLASVIAPVENTNIATRNYTTGSLVIVNNKLYKVTANIANGGAITPNTNVTATTLAEIISAL